MLGRRIEEQERMIELVRQGACKRALQEMDEKAVHKMRPEQVSRLLSALIPFRSRPAREIEELVFRNGRWSWTEKDEEGFLLHEQMIRGGRVDMAAKAAERIRKREAGDSGLSFVWAELVVYLLDVPARKVLDEVKKEVLYSALVSEHWEERLETLEQKGWTKSSRQRKGKIQFADESIRRLEKKKYASDRRGKLEQVADKARIRFVKAYGQE